jgi:DNA-binding MarR family transcriptional regulator
MTTPFDTLNPPLLHRLADGIERLATLSRADAWQASRDRGLNPLQARILRVLRAHGGGVSGAHRLAALLALTPATVSDSLSALAGKGLVVKARTRERPRALSVALSEAGHALAEALDAPTGALADALAALDPAEQSALLRVLIKMIRALQEAGRIPVARMCVSCRYFRANVHVDPDLPHHCALVDAPFADRHLRLDCAEHAPATAADAEQAWRVFAGIDRPAAIAVAPGAGMAAG